MEMFKPEMEFNTMNNVWHCACARIQKRQHFHAKTTIAKLSLLLILKHSMTGGWGMSSILLVMVPCTILIHRPDNSTVTVSGLYICTHNTNSGYNAVRNRTPILACVSTFQSGIEEEYWHGC